MLKHILPTCRYARFCLHLRSRMKLLQQLVDSFQKQNTNHLNSNPHQNGHCDLMERIQSSQNNFPGQQMVRYQWQIQWLHPNTNNENKTHTYCSEVQKYTFSEKTLLFEDLSDIPKYHAPGAKCELLLFQNGNNFNGIIEVSLWGNIYFLNGR